MGKMFKRMMAILSLGALMTSFSVNAYNEGEVSTYGTGLRMHTAEELEEEKQMQQSGIATVSEDYSDITVLRSIDLSTSDYFPVIGNQGAIESCVAWATTYYQFTYEANKLRGIVTTPENTYSPAWTYNLNVCSTGTGMIPKNAYDVLRYQGGLMMQDYPYNTENYTFDWPTDRDVIIEALKTKVVNWDTIEITTSETDVINFVSDPLLTEIKQYLCAGKVLVVSCENPSGWSYMETENGEIAVYRASQTNTGHALTVVGYDNSIECDINQNGTIEAYEKGAFKVVNSWGRDETDPDQDAWGNDGWIWVMYDALNITSANTLNNWESNEPADRLPVFKVDEIPTNTTGDGINTFFYIDVATKPVNLIGELTLSTDYRYDMGLYTNRGYFFNELSEIKAYTNSTTEDVYMPYRGTLILDYDTLDDDLVNYLSGKVWSVKIKNTSAKGNITNVSYKITDNKGVVLKDVGTIASSISNGDYIIEYIDLNLVLGDVDYDRVLTAADTDYIMKYIVKVQAIVDQFSDLKISLADYNQDQAVDVLDITAINNAMSAAESAKFTAYIAEEYNRLASTPQTASADLTPEQAQAYAELVTQLYELLCTAA